MQPEPMHIAFYMPFKPLGHDNPSGDLITGTELYEHIRKGGHRVHLVSRFRTRWLPLKPWLWPLLGPAMASAEVRARRMQAQLWLSYHTYYKAPDVLGPLCCRRLKIPYVIFQGIYSTKRRRRWRTLPGFWLNRMVLCSARMVFTNKRTDHKNLLRLLPPQRVVYVAPGIIPKDFPFSGKARRELRSRWRVDKTPVILTTAMFRPGVKTDGLLRVIRTAGRLAGQGLDFKLVIVGDGVTRSRLRAATRKHLPARAIFTGQIPRKALHRYYSAADLFVFPGIRESLGMVYLEAQVCGLPVVAYSDWGAAEAVVHDQTGLLTPSEDPERFTAAVARLLVRPDLRQEMGQAAADHVRRRHDIGVNYAAVVEWLRHVVATSPQRKK